MADLVFVALGFFSGIVGSVLVALTIGHYNKLNLQSNSFTTIFKMLSEEKHWEARRNVLKSYKEFIKNDEPDFELFDEKDMRLVRSDFDQIGVMIYKEITPEQIGDKELDKDRLGRSKGFIPKELFFEEFSGSVINSWYALEYITKFQRQHTYSERYMLFFEQLYEDAKDFRQFKSKLQKEREDDVTISAKLECWIEDIPNRDTSDADKIKNYR